AASPSRTRSRGCPLRSTRERRRSVSRSWSRSPSCRSSRGPVRSTTSPSTTSLGSPRARSSTSSAPPDRTGARERAGLRRGLGPHPERRLDARRVESGGPTAELGAHVLVGAPRAQLRAAGGEVARERGALDPAPGGEHVTLGLL